MSKKTWCFFGVHEYKIVDQGPYEKWWGNTLTKYYILQCQCCGKIRRKVLC